MVKQSRPDDSVDLFSRQILPKVGANGSIAVGHIFDGPNCRWSSELNSAPSWTSVVLPARKRYLAPRRIAGAPSSLAKSVSKRDLRTPGIYEEGDFLTAVYAVR